MKRILIAIGTYFLLVQAPVGVQGSPMLHSVQLEHAQEMDSRMVLEKTQERRWPRWLRRLLNRRGNGQRPGGGRRGGR